MKTAVRKRRNGAKAGEVRKSRQEAPKRTKVKYSARELAGSLRCYAKGRPDAARVRAFVKQEVARAAAQER